MAAHALPGANARRPAGRRGAAAAAGGDAQRRSRRRGAAAAAEASSTLRGAIGARGAPRDYPICVIPIPPRRPGARRRPVGLSTARHLARPNRHHCALRARARMGAPSNGAPEPPITSRGPARPARRAGRTAAARAPRRAAPRAPMRQLPPIHAAAARAALFQGSHAPCGRRNTLPPARRPREALPARRAGARDPCPLPRYTTRQLPPSIHGPHCLIAEPTPKVLY